MHHRLVSDHVTRRSVEQEVFSKRPRTRGWFHHAPTMPPPLLWPAWQFDSKAANNQEGQHSMPFPCKLK
eukprot:3966705-Amphidinium_carterae.1